jgi:signal transduction histidine kinase
VARSGHVRDPEARDKLVELAFRQGTRLAKLIDDLLDVSRIEAGHLRLDLSDVDLCALVDEVVGRLQGDLERTRCSVKVHGDGPVVGKWDRSRIDQVVTHLLSNAIKFGAGTPIDVFLDRKQGVARLSIRDHGIGIEPAEHDRIFGRCERAASERHYGGLGLGLYLCRGIVEQHAGSIRCESEPGAGSSFTIELPLGGPPERNPRA